MPVRQTLLIALLVALAAPALASAGGWTTVGLTAPPGEELRAGGTWNAELTVLQHGRTPLAGQKPLVTVTSGARSATFTARPTAEVGVYRAAVVFPAAGSWRVTVDHGWGVEHKFGPFTIAAGATTAAIGSPSAGEPPTAGATDDDSWIAVVAAVIAGLGAAGGAAFFLRRRSRAVPAP